MIADAPPPSPPPAVVTTTERLGTTQRGRPITMTVRGRPDATIDVLDVGVIHGNERAGLPVIRRLARDVPPRFVRYWLVQRLNVDGAIANTRQNARGVDLNRNFPLDWSDDVPAGDLEYGGPRPLSEPESRGYRDLVRVLHPDITVIYHQPWGVVLAPCRGPAPLQRLYARTSGMRLDRCRGEGLPGTATRWTDARDGTAFVVELAAGRLGQAEADRHALAIRKLARG